MIPQNLNSAINIANNAYAGMYDKSNNPMILHPLHVMQNVWNDTEAYGSRWYELAWITAILHDIVEDDLITIGELWKQLNLTYNHNECEAIFNSIDLLTHRSEDTYAEYIQHIVIQSCTCQNIPLYVKRADILHNISYNRMRGLLHTERERLIKKYEPAYSLITKAIMRLEHANQVP